MKKFLFVLFVIIVLSTIIPPYASLVGEEGDDVWGIEFDCFFTTILLVPVVFSEISIYFNCLYFFTEKDKETSKTVFNIIMCINSIALLLAIVVLFYSFYQNYDVIILILFAVSVLLRCINWMKK
jgi:hypothetical protein